MYRYPPTLSSLSSSEAHRAAIVVAYPKDGSVVVEVIGVDGALLARTVTALTGCLATTTGLVMDASPLAFVEVPCESRVGGAPALSGAVHVRS